MTFELTKEQQQARDFTGSDLLVSAAAGSGKTAVLVERILKMLRNPEKSVSLENMLIVTFTTAAASQMKEKIEQKLLEALEEEPDNSFLEEQFRFVSSAHIQTNHSFSLYVVKNYITRLPGLDPGFRIADDTEAVLLRMDVLRSTLEYWYNEALKPSCSQEAADFLFFADCFGGVRQDVSIEKLVLDVYDFMLSEPDPLGWLDRSIGFYEAHAKEDEHTKNLSLPALYGLRVLLKSFMKALREEKERRNLIEIADFEHLCLELLSDDAVSKDLSGQFDYIFVDEYQDCNRIQEEILQKIARKDENGHSMNLFMVGDVKQSIYGFRHADPSMFLNKYKTFSKDEPGAPRKILLKKNFRSCAGVIDTVNYFFSALMIPEVGGLEYGPDEELVLGSVQEPDEALNAADQSDYHDAGTAPSAEFVCLQTEQATAEELLKLEAAEAAGIIQKEIEGGKDPSDIVILLRSVKQTAGVFVDALKARGIEAISSSSENFYETFEIRMVLNLLRVIDNPRQDIPLAGVMLGFAGGFTEDELALIRLGNQEGLLFDALCSFPDRSVDGALKDKVCAFLSMLFNLREKSRLLNVHDFLWEVYVETGIYLFVSSMPGGKTRAANLDLMLTKSAAFEEGTYHGLYQFIRYIDQMEKERQTEAEAKVIEEGAHAVSVISIHKSKGLEYPVVLVCGLGKKRNDSSLNGRLLMHDTLGIGLDPVDPEKSIVYESPVKTMIRARLKQEQIAEEIRLLYVAMTRAQKKLYLIGSEAASDKKKEADAGSGQVLDMEQVINGKTPLEWLKLICEKKKEQRPFKLSFIERSVEDLDEEADGATADLYDSETIRHKSGKDSAELSEEAKAQIRYQYPFRELGMIPQLVSVSQLKREYMTEPEDSDLESAAFPGMEDADEQEEAFGKEKSAGTDNTVEKETAAGKENTRHTLSGSERGTLFHTVVALAPVEDLKAGRYSKILEELVKNGQIGKESVGELPVSWLRGWASSPLFARMAASPLVFREEAFIMAMTAAELKKYSARYDLPEHENQETVMVQGIIDCFFQEEDAWVLLDYKTDKVLDDAKMQSYQTQLSLYQKAIERSTGKKVKEKYIYDVVRHRVIPC